MRSKAPAVRLVLAAGALMAAREMLRRHRETDLRGQVALISGGSRGLGLLLAREQRPANILVAAPAAGRGT